MFVYGRHTKKNMHGGLRILLFLYKTVTNNKQQRACFFVFLFFHLSIVNGAPGAGMSSKRIELYEKITRSRSHKAKNTYEYKYKHK